MLALIAVTGLFFGFVGVVKEGVKIEFGDSFRHRSGIIWSPPHDESSPVHSLKLVKVGYTSDELKEFRRIIRPLIVKNFIVHLIGEECVPKWPRLFYWGCDGNCSSSEFHCHIALDIGYLLQGFEFDGRINEIPALHYFQRRAVPEILETIVALDENLTLWHRSNLVYGDRHIQPDPGALGINGGFPLYATLCLHLTPHLVGDSGIYRSSDDGPNGGKEHKPIKDYLPPWRFTMAALAGALSSLWGWWNLRRECRENLATIVFLSGLGLWGYSVYIFLFWILAL